MIKAQAGTSTALGDTTKTSMGTITVPATARRIVGIWGYAVGGAGNTTLENLSGIMELESPDINIQPLQLPLDTLALTGTGMSQHSPRIFPANIPVSGNEKITCYMTLDLAQTIANTGRWGLIYESD